MLVGAGDLREMATDRLASLGELSKVEAQRYESDTLAALFSLGIHPSPSGGRYTPHKSLQAASMSSQILESETLPNIPTLKAKEWEILQRRLLKGDTLNAIGQDFEVTRERIRQIEAKAARKLCRSLPIDAAAIEIFGELIKRGRIASVHTVMRLSPGADITKGLRLLFKLIRDRYKSFEFIEELGIITFEGRGAAAHLLSDAVEKFSDMPPMALDALKDAIASFCAYRRLNDPAMKATMLNHLVSEGFAERPDGKWACNRGTLTARYAEAFRFLYPDGFCVHKKSAELAASFRQHFGDTLRVSSERSAVACLLNNPDVVLLERGRHIHVSSIAFDKQLLDVAVSRCMELFESGISHFHLTRVFDDLEPQMKQGGIPTAELLHSLIRRSKNPLVGLGRCPAVFDQKLHDERMPRTQEVESYVEAAEREVSLQELTSEFCGVRGWREYSLAQAISNSDRIMNFDHGIYELFGRRNLNDEALEELAEFLDEKTAGFDGRVELKVVQSEKPLLWQRLGRHPMPFLWSNLRIHFPDRFRYMPTSGVAQPASQHTTRSNDLVNYILDKGREAYAEELKSEFLIKRGWAELSYYNAIQAEERIIRSSPRSYTVRSLLEWSPKKAEALEDVLLRLLSEVRALENRPFVTWHRVANAYYKELPAIPDSHSWSPDLVASLSRDFESIITIEGAFVRSGNSFEISDLDDLLAYLVSRQFGGACEESALMEHLKNLKIYSGTRVPIRALQQGSSICRDDSLVISLSEPGWERYGKYIVTADLAAQSVV